MTCDIPSSAGPQYGGLAARALGRGYVGSNRHEHPPAAGGHPMAREGTSVDKARTAPHEDDSRKPDSLGDLTKPSWRYTAKKALTEFGRDQCTDLAAALTYYAVLAIFPALLALVSLLGVFGQGESTTSALLDIVRSARAGDCRRPLEGPIEQMTQTRAAGFALVLGLARRHLVGLRLRRRLRPRHEPDLPDRRGTPGLEAAAAAAACSRWSASSWPRSCSSAWSSAARWPSRSATSSAWGTPR